MTRQERREKWPDVAAFCDDMLSVFDGASISHVSLPGYVYGVAGDKGTQAILRDKPKEKRK